MGSASLLHHLCGNLNDALNSARNTLGEKIEEDLFEFKGVTFGIGREVSRVAYRELDLFLL